MGKLAELGRELERIRQNSYDVVVPSSQLKVETNGDGYGIKMVVPHHDGTIGKHGLTEYAHSQLSDKTKIPRKYYERMRLEGKYDLLAQNVNAWLPEKERRLIRILDGNVRAILSDRYRPIDNYDVYLKTLTRFKHIHDTKKVDITVADARLTDTHLYIKALSSELVDEIIDKLQNRNEPVQGGIIIRNSEVGAGAFRVEPFVQVIRCTNGLISLKKFSKVHLGRKLDEGEINWSDDIRKKEDDLLWAKIEEMIDNTFDKKIFHKWVDRMQGASEVELEKPKLALENITKRFNLPQREVEELENMFFKESPTQWGLAMAVTRYAHEQPDYNRQIELEEIGNEIIGLDPKVLTVETE